MNSVRKLDMGVASASVVTKTVSPTNPLESDPTKTDTMQEDPTVDSLKVPTSYFDIMNPKKQGKPKQPERVEAPSPNPSGTGPVA